MYWNKARTLLFRVLPISLFVLGCFPSRGLYFLLHSSQSDEHYHISQPVFSVPTSPTPKWKAAKVPLPPRLTRVPRTVKQTPYVPAPNLERSFVLLPADPVFTLVSAEPDFFLPQSPPASPPPGRAPPAAI